MIEFKLQNNKKNLILFVHGFCGGDDTWKNGDSPSFAELLAQDEIISNNYDIANYSYYTKLTNLYSKVSGIGTLLKRLFGTSHGKLAKNVSIEEISSLLTTEIRFQLQSYDNIVLIAHSMGGLVAKSAIVKAMEDQQPSKIKFFVSLAVPHLGAEAATFGKLISSNLQIENLAPLNNFIHQINDKWQKSNTRPETKYFYGLYDDTVSKNSAVPIDKEKSDGISLDEDHTSITKPESSNSTIYLAVKQVILDFDKNDSGMSTLSLQTLPNDDIYNDELFVLKLLSADVHNSSIKSSKEYFLNAEYIRKKFTSASDQKRLADLYQRIRNIYETSYTKYVHGGITNSGMLLADVHEKIITEDKKFLEIFIPFINAIHKQGMLHQLANSEVENIWWDKDGAIEKLTKLIDKEPHE